MDNKDNKITIESIVIKDVSKSIDEYCKILDMIKKEMFDSLAIPKDKFKFDYTTSLGHPYYFDRQYNFYSGPLIKEPEKSISMYVDVNEDFTLKAKFKRFILVIRNYFRNLWKNQRELFTKYSRYLDSDGRIDYDKH